VTDERTIPAGTSDALLAPQLTPIGLVELQFGSGTVRLWTGFGDLPWNGFIWTGAGTLGRIGPMEETVESRASALELTLSSIPAEVLAIANAEDWQGREARIWYGVLDDARHFVGEPFQIRRGIMDLMTLSEGAEASITLAIESRDIDLGRNKARRYTAEDQRAEYPGDRGCDAVALLQQWDGTWAVS
jgi:hypothetical protein